MHSCGIIYLKIWKYSFIMYECTFVVSNKIYSTQNIFRERCLDSFWGTTLEDPYQFLKQKKLLDSRDDCLDGSLPISEKKNWISFLWEHSFKKHYQLRISKNPKKHIDYSCALPRYVITNSLDRYSCVIECNMLFWLEPATKKWVMSNSLRQFNCSSYSNTEI